MSKLNVETIENLSATASLNVSDIASKNAFSADTGASLVGFKANGVGAVASTVQNKLRESVSVLDYMTPVEKQDVLSGTHLVDVSAAINTAIAENESVNLFGFQYLIGSPVNVTGGKRLLVNGATLLKNFNGVGLVITGGSSFNYIEGDLEVRGFGAFASNTAVASTSPTAHGVTVTNNRLIVNGNLQATYNQGNGVLFTASAPNSNRCVLTDVRVRFNGEHGIQFSGSHDDAAVWRVNLYADGNRKSGVVTDPDFMGRNWQGFIYTEGNAVDTVSTGCNLQKLRSSDLYIYSEEQQAAAREVVIGANCSDLLLVSIRVNKDDDYSLPANNNVWLRGRDTYSPGYGGGPRFAIPSVIKASRARLGNPGEYVSQEYYGGNDLFGSVRADAGSTTPTIEMRSADGTSYSNISNTGYDLVVAGVRYLGKTTGGFALGLGTFSDTGATSGKEVNSTTTSLQSSRNSTSSRDHIEFYNPNGKVGGISTSASSTSYTTTSDARLKTNIAPSGDPSNLIDDISVVQHDWKVDGAHVEFGVIAQELFNVFPSAVIAGDSGEQITNVWSVDYSKLVPVLVKELQLLRARVAALEASQV